MSAEQELAKFQKSIKKFKKIILAQKEEIAKNGEASKETLKALEKSEADFKEKFKVIDEIQTKSQERIDKFELRMNRPNGFGAQNLEAEKNLGDRFVESDIFKSMVKNGEMNSRKFEVKGGFAPYFQKSLNSVVSPIVVPHFPPGIVEGATRQLKIRDLLVSQPTTSNSIEYVKETAFNQLYALITVASEVATAVFTVDNAYGFYADQVITLNHSTPFDKIIDSVDYDTGVITLTTNTGFIVAIGASVVAPTFVFTPETKLKPLADATLAFVTRAVKTLAHHLPASRQILADVPQLQSYVNRRLITGLKLSEEQQILYGDGTSAQLNGIMTDTDILTYSWSAGTVGDTKIDAIRRAMTLVALAHYQVDAVIVNPVDWEEIQLAKGSDGHYIWASVSNSGVMMIWGVPVVVTSAITSGEALAGAFSMGATLWDRQQATIRISEHNKDNFETNMITILAEERLCLTVERPPSFVKITFDNTPAA